MASEDFEGDFKKDGVVKNAAILNRETHVHDFKIAGYINSDPPISWYKCECGESVEREPSVAQLAYFEGAV